MCAGEAPQAEPHHDLKHAEDDRVGAQPEDDGQAAHHGRMNSSAPNAIDNAPARPSAHSCSITRRSLMALAISSAPETIAQKAITQRNARPVDAGQTTATMPAAM